MDFDTHSVRLVVGAALVALVSLGIVACSEDVDADNTNQGDGADVVDDYDTGDAGPTDDPDADDSDTGPDDPDTGPDDPDADNGSDDPDADNGDEELADLAVDALRPDRGPVDGGTPFVIEGEGFTNDTTVLFGSAETETDLVIGLEDDEGELTGTTPAGETTGPVSVRVVDDVTGEETLTDGFTYIQPLEIDSVSPSTVLLRGGAEVTVHGDGFSADSQVVVGDRAAAEVNYVNAGELRFIAPPQDAPGPRDLRVTNEDDSVVDADAIDYIAPAEIDAVDPSYGTTDGSDDVVVTGQHFDDSLQVVFGNTAGVIDDVSADGTEATVTTPGGSPGPVDVAVDTEAGGNTLDDGFVYLDDSHTEPALDAVTPQSGSTDGDERVYLVGYFDGLSDPVVEFGGEEADVVQHGEEVVAVDTPASETGTVDVVVDDGDETLTASDAFRFYSPLSIDNVSPSEGDAAGGTSVTVTGSGFEAANSARLAGLSLNIDVLDDQTLEFTTPAGSPGYADLRIETDDDRSVTKQEAFLYLGDLDVWNFSPTQGSTAGNTYVEIRGTGFSDETDVSFGGQPATDIELLNPNALAVRTPANDTGGVEVSAEDGDQESTAHNLYTYFNPGAQSGGAWGNPIDGAVNVTVFSYMGMPIDEAVVFLSTDGGTQYQGLTNATGQITLSGPDVYGTQTVSATAVDHSSATVQYVDAENITIFLFPLDGDGDPPETPPPPTATFHGDVSGLDKISTEPHPDKQLMAIVETTRTEIGEQLPPPGGGNVVYEDGPYSIETRIGELALVALGGLYDSSEEEFTPKWMGTERYLTAADGGEYEVDIDLDIPLQSEMSFKFQDAPHDVNIAQKFIDLGVDGIYGPMDNHITEEELTQIDGLAALTGDLDDASYHIEAISTPDTATIPGHPVLQAPQSQTSVSGIDDLETTQTTPPMASTLEVVVPEIGEKAEDGLVQWETTGNIAPDLYYFYIPGMGGTVLWDVFVSADSKSYQFPSFPDFDAYDLEDDEGNPVEPEPYFAGTPPLIGVMMNGLELSIDNYAYDSLGSAESISMSPILLQLPDND